MPETPKTPGTPDRFPEPQQQASGESSRKNSVSMSRIMEEFQARGSPGSPMAHFKERVSREMQLETSPALPEPVRQFPDVHSLIESVISHPDLQHCLGLLYLLTTDKYLEELHLTTLLGQNDAAGKLKKSFELMGFAVIWHRNPTKEEVSVAVDYLSSAAVVQRFPKGYQFFSCYVACHGDDYGFTVHDGSVPFETITRLAKTESLKEVFRAFLFFIDCCRGQKPGASSPLYPETKMEGNTMILYAVSSGEAAAGPGSPGGGGPGGGASYMMHHLTELLVKDKTLVQLFMDLRKRVSCLGPKTSKQVFPLHTTMIDVINLLQERNKRMTPLLDMNGITVSSDAAYVTLVFHSPPPVNRSLFRDEKYLVEMRSLPSGQWECQPITKHSELSDGKISIKAEINPVSRPIALDVVFRVVTKMKSQLLQLESNIVECILPASARPEIVAAVVNLRDGQPLEVLLSWQFPRSQLPLTHYTVVLIRKRQRQEDIQCSFKLQYKEGEEMHHTHLTLATVELMEWNDFNRQYEYEAMVAIETKDGRLKINSDTVALNKDIVTPWLDDVSYSADGVMVTGQVALDHTLTANPDNYRLQIKPSSRDSEWITLKNFRPEPSRARAISNASERPIPTTIEVSLEHTAADNRHQTPEPTQKVLVKASLLLESPEKEQVMFYVNRNDNAKFRVVSHVDNTLKIPSVAFRKDGPFPTPVTPEVIGCAKVHYPTTGDPLVSLTWQLREIPSTPGSKFIVHVATRQEGFNYSSSPIAYESSRRKYHHSFRVPDLPREELTVCVRETRADGSVFTSPLVDLVSSTACCYGKLSRKCVCGVTFFGLIFALSTLVCLATASCLGYSVYYSKYHSPNQTVSYSTSGQTEPLPKPPPLDMILGHFLSYNFSQRQVTIFRTTETADLHFYCAVYDSAFLNNHRAHMITNSTEHNQTISHMTHYFPLSATYPDTYQMLSGSWFWVNMCLSHDLVDFDPKLYLMLYKVNTEDWFKNPMIFRKRAEFGGCRCVNVTPATVDENGAIFVAIQTPDVVKFAETSVGASRFYYDPIVLGLAANKSNKIAPGNTKPLPGSQSSQVVCLNTHGTFGLYHNLYSISVPLVFKQTRLWGYLVLTILTLLAAVASGLVGCWVYRSRGKCVTCTCLSRGGYETIN